MRERLIEIVKEGIREILRMSPEDDCELEQHVHLSITLEALEELGKKKKGRWDIKLE